MKRHDDDTLLDDLLLAVDGAAPRGASTACRSVFRNALQTCACRLARQIAMDFGLGADDFVQVLQKLCVGMGVSLTEGEQDRERLVYLSRDSLAYGGDSGVGSDGSGQIDEDAGGIVAVVAYRKDRAE